MPQYKTGTVTLTGGSNIVNGVGTEWLANASIGNSFKRSGEDAIYTIASVDSDTQIKLTINYAGSSGAGISYQIGRDYTPNNQLAEIAAGDEDWPAHLTIGVIRKLDTLVNLGNQAGYFQIDESGGLMPITGAASNDPYYELDGNGDIMPKTV